MLECVPMASSRAGIAVTVPKHFRTVVDVGDVRRRTRVVQSRPVEPGKSGDAMQKPLQVFSSCLLRRRARPALSVAFAFAFLGVATLANAKRAA